MKKKVLITLSIFIIPFIFVFIALKINASTNKDNKNNDDRYIIAKPTGTIPSDSNYEIDDETIDIYYENAFSVIYVENDSRNYHYYFLNDDGTVNEDRPIWLSIKNAMFFNNNLEEVSKDEFVLSDNYVFKISFKYICMTYPAQINALYVFI
ncbi:MAG: hypothetical protein K5892_07405 [Acholeplasmatales bacterium]|nr:hypothetical protein [Acholeplasmatales bacterium]